MANLKPLVMQLLEQGRAFQQQFIADLDQTEHTISGTWENWSIKDELAHIVAWQLNAVARMAALVHHEAPPDFSDSEAINRAVFATQRDRVLTDILADGQQAWADLHSLLTPLSEEALIQKVHFSEQESRSMADLALGNFYWHPLTHYTDYYRRRGDWPKAIRWQEQAAAAVTAVPEWFGLARYNLACFYALNGRPAQALAALREALPLRPDLAEWSKQDTDLDSLRDDPAYQALYQT